MRSSTDAGGISDSGRITAYTTGLGQTGCKGTGFVPWESAVLHQ
jgi:hypothetical protein